MEDKRIKFKKGKQKELVQFLLKRNDFTQYALAEKLNIHKRRISDYFNEKVNMRLSTFQKITSIYPDTNWFNKFVENKLPLSWGARLGGFSRARQITDKGGYYAWIRGIKTIRELEKAKQTKVGLNSHPLIEQLKAEKVDLESILGVCLLTDGSMQVKGRHYRISYSTIDKTLQELIFSLMNDLSVRVPSISFSKKANSIRVSDGNLGAELLKLSPNFKTSPSWYETKEEYLSTKQPTLSFLDNCNEQTRRWAIRFGFSADGSISHSITGKSELSIACYHPSLSFEWMKLLESFGLNCKIGKNINSWCGISGVRAQNYPSIKKFYELGGFIDGVKISKKSRRYRGYEKNDLLKSIVENGGGRI